VRLELDTAEGYGNGERTDIRRHAFPQPQNDGEGVFPYTFPLGPNNERLPWTRDYWATPTMAHSATLMPDRISHFRRHGVRIEIVGDGLLPAMVAHNAIPNTGTATAPALDTVARQIPAAKPRKRAVERLPIVSFMWEGHIPYTAEDVKIWANQVQRNLARDHELVCIADWPETVREALDYPGAPRVSCMTMWRDQFEHGRDWHRLKLFAEEMADVIGPRFVVMDLDTVICGQLDPLFETDAPYKAWRDPSRDQYCTALQIMDAGAFPHVWEWFQQGGRETALQLRKQGVFGGYDQAWISHVLPGQERWTRADGVLSFRKDICEGIPLERVLAMDAAETAIFRKPRPEGARIINFHGKHNPRDADVQAAFPWIGEFYR
jgi:hypothetical protein